MPQPERGSDKESSQQPQGPDEAARRAARQTDAQAETVTIDCPLGCGRKITFKSGERNQAVAKHLKSCRLNGWYKGKWK